MNSRIRDEVDGIVEEWARERPDFNTEPLTIFSRLLRLSYHIERVRKLAFSSHGLENWEFEMLSALRRQGTPYRLTAGRLMQETLVSSGTVTNRIDRMVESGHARRIPDTDDKRVVHVEATPEGLALVDAAMADLLALEAVHVEEMTKSERTELAHSLRALLAHFEKNS